MTPTPQSPPQIPASPGASFAWAAGWLLIAVLGFIVLILNWQRALAGELSGQRTEGIVILTPIAATVIAVLLVVRGLVAIGRTRNYRARYSAELRARIEAESLRGQPWKPFLAASAIIGALWLAGAVALAVFGELPSRRLDGLSMILMLMGLLALMGIGSLRAGLRRRAAAQALAQS